MGYKIFFTKTAQKDLPKIKSAKLLNKLKLLVDLMMENPFQVPPPYEKLAGDLGGKYSRRINLQHRLIYEINESQQIVKILRMWTRYE